MDHAPSHIGQWLRNRGGLAIFQLTLYSTLRYTHRVAPSTLGWCAPKMNRSPLEVIGEDRE